MDGRKSMTAWAAAAALTALAGLFILLGGAQEWRQGPSVSHAQEGPPLEYERCRGKPYHDTPISVTEVTAGSPPVLEHYRIEWDEPPREPGASWSSA